MKRKLALFLATTSLVYSFAGTAYAAPNVKAYDSAQETVTRSAAGVAIFVAGVLVGYIVDGVIIYTTGHSAGEWTAIALDYYYTHQTAFDSGDMTAIHISSDGTVHGGGGGDFR